MSMLRAIVAAMGGIGTLIIVYLIISPAYFTTLDALNSTVIETSDPGSDAANYADWAYYAFFYGLPTIVVLGIIGYIWWLFRYSRRTWWASGEVVYR